MTTDSLQIGTHDGWIRKDLIVGRGVSRESILISTGSGCWLGQKERASDVGKCAVTLGRVRGRIQRQPESSLCVCVQAPAMQDAETDDPPDTCSMKCCDDVRIQRARRIKGCMWERNDPSTADRIDQFYVWLACSAADPSVDLARRFTRLPCRSIVRLPVHLPPWIFRMGGWRLAGAGAHEAVFSIRALEDWSADLNVPFSTYMLWYIRSCVGSKLVSASL